jgi:hypothetical protein
MGVRAYIGDVHGDFTLAHHVYDHIVDNFLDGQIPDQLIQVGDYGFGLVDGMWNDMHGNHPLPEYRLFIDGNHEYHEHLWASWVDVNGLNWLKDKIFQGWQYGMRGHIQDGMVFLGGAESSDKKQRLARARGIQGEDTPEHMVDGHIWSHLEQLRPIDIVILHALAKKNKFSTVVSHTFPSECDMLWACNPSYGMNERKSEATRVLLQQALERYRDQISLWVGGHWHRGKHWKQGNIKYVLLNTVSSLPARNFEHLNECFYIEEY